MGKTIIVSNRLPVSIEISEGQLEVKQSVGGLATGVRSVHRSADSIWIGWTGLVEESVPDKMRPRIADALTAEKCLSVPLYAEEIQQFYFGFSNKTIWPLFHYFTQFVEFDKNTWQSYCAVNQKYADVVMAQIEPDDRVWIHDYQLLLLPQLIKAKYPKTPIGFFLHIPFPSFEILRVLPWRLEILTGMLGADLIGFHTYNYERHFFSSVRRLLGYEISFNEINLRDRIVLADSFPMGIDYDRFHEAARAQQQKSIKDKSKIQQALDKHVLMTPDVKLVLSIDRLDYTKGVANRLRAFEFFLEKYPEFREKVTLVLLSVPSRENVDQYQVMKSEVDELIGRINGEHSTINWTPIWYFYRSLPFENLIDLYTSCEVALLTPIRDGMNLVAKEYIASRIDQKGVLILSEMAGAAQEMSEALVINPNNHEEIAMALKDALTMPEDEQIKRNTMLQSRLKRYNVGKWASDFMHALGSVKAHQEKYFSKKLTVELMADITARYRKAAKRILFLDYDGTLVGFRKKPEDAFPDDELYSILDALASDERNQVVLISGRDVETFSSWFYDRNYTLIVEHGVCFKYPGQEWQLIEPMNVQWKESIRPVMEFYVDRTPGTFVEEKHYSLVWHYRRSDPDLGNMRANELKDELSSFIANHNLEILDGNKVLEVKNNGINKGRAALRAIGRQKYDFILGIGDDWTDEDLFHELPPASITIKVGVLNTYARFKVDTFTDVRMLLSELAGVNTNTP